MAPAKRMELILTERDETRLKALEAKWELKRPDIIRQAIKEKAERDGVERHDSEGA